jgi:hypothetical protein
LVTKKIRLSFIGKSITLVCGHRREIFPEKTIYNRFCDNAYTDYFIEGEELEMCSSRHQKNWAIFRLKDEMILLYANIAIFFQWLKRVNRANFTFALSAKEYDTDNEKFGIREAALSLVWLGLLRSKFHETLEVIELIIKITKKNTYN